MSIEDQERIDFTGGDLHGWTLDEYPRATVVQEGESSFLRSDNPLYYNGMVLSKSVPGLTVGGYYEFSVALRTHGQKGMGLQVILDDGHSGVHSALDIDLAHAQVTPGRWQQLKGYIFKRNTTVTDDVLINAYGIFKLDMDDVRLSLTPVDARKVSFDTLTVPSRSMLRR
ncbi:hypothetical protein BJI69_13425 [Luteibacter rhizovicinus DSM 16549]|uniref:Uncharacterized protein n=1 Tax=Luteibacter rhizovicinus DSM 16549 TaxID=1440763 RepID=A0A0G9H930_9GAMM|nr:hypothetical protein [Luteibacter rhizovicinus]APG04796.1 hypothetical protein BJI69_13425 [Luteibacter rhizovicinus DSM 16549]KLD66310.1 hypothetical protein Y883_14530 [Luteibacter rhizovicinus DSM 16549]